MSKITIKFWNVDRKEYERDSLSSNLLVNESGEAFVDTDYDLACPAGGDFEVHFFKDGERVA